MSVLKLNNSSEHSNVWHDFVASLASILQVIQEKENDSDDFLFIKVV
jgi:hypothetical protein